MDYSSEDMLRDEVKLGERELKKAKTKQKVRKMLERPGWICGMNRSENKK